MTHDEAVNKLNQLRTFFIGGARDNYLTIRHRYKRDMEIVNRIREEIGK